MSKDKSSKGSAGGGSHTHNPFDPANLLGSPFAPAAAASYASLQQMPSAFNMMAPYPGAFPTGLPPFGGLGATPSSMTGLNGSMPSPYFPVPSMAGSTPTTSTTLSSSKSSSKSGSVSHLKPSAKQSSSSLPSSSMSSSSHSGSRNSREPKGPREHRESHNYRDSCSQQYGRSHDSTISASASKSGSITSGTPTKTYTSNSGSSNSSRKNSGDCTSAKQTSHKNATSVLSSSKSSKTATTPGGTATNLQSSLYSMYGLPDPAKYLGTSASSTSATSSTTTSTASSLPGAGGSLLEDPYGVGAMNSLFGASAMFSPFSYNSAAAAAAMQMQMQYAAAAQSQMMLAGLYPGMAPDPAMLAQYAALQQQMGISTAMPTVTTTSTQSKSHKVTTKSSTTKSSHTHSSPSRKTASSLHSNSTSSSNSLPSYPSSHDKTTVSSSKAFSSSTHALNSLAMMSHTNSSASSSCHDASNRKRQYDDASSSQGSTRPPSVGGSRTPSLPPKISSPVSTMSGSDGKEAGTYHHDVSGHGHHTNIPKPVSDYDRGSDALSELSYSDDDFSPHKHRDKEMPNLKREVPQDILSTRTPSRAASVSSSQGHPPTPDLVQDLSVKRSKHHTPERHVDHLQYSERHHTSNRQHDSTRTPDSGQSLSRSSSVDHKEIAQQHLHALSAIVNSKVSSSSNLPDMKSLLSEMSLKSTSGGSVSEKLLMEKSAELMATPPLGSSYHSLYNKTSGSTPACTSAAPLTATANAAATAMAAAAAGVPPEFYFPFYDASGLAAVGQHAAAAAFMNPAAALFAGGMLDPTGLLLGSTTSASSEASNNTSTSNTNSSKRSKAKSRGRTKNVTDTTPGVSTNSMKSSRSSPSSTLLSNKNKSKRTDLIQMSLQQQELFQREELKKHLEKKFNEELLSASRLNKEVMSAKLKHTRGSELSKNASRRDKSQSPLSSRHGTPTRHTYLHQPQAPPSKVPTPQSPPHTSGYAVSTNTTTATGTTPNATSAHSKLAQALLGDDNAVLRSHHRKPTSKANTVQVTDSEGIDSDEASSDESSADEAMSDADTVASADSREIDPVTGDLVRKRPASDQEPRRKRKRLRDLDINEIKVPLDHGWSRQTRIRAMGCQGIIGEVIYFTPCRKKLRSYPEVMRYLHRNNITDLTRDNFTFSPKVGVGEFLEAREGSTENGFVVLSEDEVHERLFSVKNRQQVRLTESGVDAARRRKEEERKAAQEKLQKKLQQQALEAKKLRDQEKLKKQQERLQKLEQEKEQKRQQAILLREQEKEQRKQMMLLVTMERERRRQHMLLVKALDTRKKLEERDKLREKRQREKRQEIERRMELKRIEMERAIELEKPVDDMRLKDLKNLPKLERVAGIKLPGNAFADCLMVVEFLRTFGDALGLHKSELPDLKTLQSSLLDISDSGHVYVTLLDQLLHFAREDPGFNNPKEAVTLTGQRIEEVSINQDNLSEILRLFMRLRNGNHDDELSTLLKTYPIQALNPTLKAAALAFVCNELLCSKTLSGEIDKNIDNMTKLRRDKWEAENKLRGLRLIQAKRMRIDDSLNKSMSESQTVKSTVTSEDEMEDDSMQDEPANNTATHTDGNASNDDSSNAAPANTASSTTNNTTVTATDAQQPHVPDEEEDLTNEELDKKIEKITKQHSQYQNKVMNNLYKLRGIDLGQDRHRRRYWVLPHCGGVWVEGYESAGYCDPSEVETPLIEEENKIVTTNDQEQSVKREAKDCDTMEPKIEAKEEVSAGSDTNVNEALDAKVKDEGDRQEIAVANKTLTNGDICHEFNGVIAMDTDICDVSPSKLRPLLVDSANDGDVKDEKPHISAATYNGKCTSELDRTAKLDAFMESLNETAKQLGVLELDNKNKSLSAEQMLRDFSARVASTQMTWFSILPQKSCAPPAPQQDPALQDPVLFNPLSPSPSTATGDYSSNCSSPSGHAYFSSAKVNSGGTSTPVLPPHAISLCRLDDLQYEKPQPMPRDCQNGWWKITDSAQLRQLLHALHQRGIRERVMHKNIQKYADYAAIMCDKNTPEVACLDDTTDPTVKMTEPWVPARHEAWLHGSDTVVDVKRLKTQSKRSFKQRLAKQGSVDSTDSGGEQPDTVQESSSGAGSACSNEQRADSVDRCSNDDRNTKYETACVGEDVCLTAEMDVLEEIENMEERVFTASLQIKGIGMFTKVSSDEPLVSCIAKKEGDGMQCVLELAKERLINLERSIERRYIKPPFIKGVKLTLASMQSRAGQSRDIESCSEDDDDDDDDDAAPALLRWRDAVNNATSAAQLTLCIIRLSSCIAWEKSIMRVMCQICCLDDNEESLLLCDGCDKGYHTYCFKPPLEKIPEGDWYCFECIAKATGEPCCVACGKKTPRLLRCDKCPRAMHFDCIKLPHKHPRKWTCKVCLEEKARAKSKSKKSLSTLSTSSHSSTLGSVTTPTTATTAREASPATTLTPNTRSQASSTGGVTANGASANATTSAADPTNSTSKCDTTITTTSATIAQTTSTTTAATTTTTGTVTSKMVSSCGAGGNDADNSTSDDGASCTLQQQRQQPGANSETTMDHISEVINSIASLGSQDSINNDYANTRTKQKVVDSSTSSTTGKTMCNNTNISGVARDCRNNTNADIVSNSNITNNNSSEDTRLDPSIIAHAGTTLISDIDTSNAATSSVRKPRTASSSSSDQLSLSTAASIATAGVAIGGSSICGVNHSDTSTSVATTLSVGKPLNSKSCTGTAKQHNTPNVDTLEEDHRLAVRTLCTQVMTLLEDHESAWPFMEPVNTKQFPTYKKVIKHPMDFQTMRAKISNAAYKTAEEFASDALLVFSNCQRFNEDDSAVGQAGFIMKTFFEKQWKQLNC